MSKLTINMTFEITELTKRSIVNEGSITSKLELERVKNVIKNYRKFLEERQSHLDDIIANRENSVWYTTEAVYNTKWCSEHNYFRTSFDGVFPPVDELIEFLKNELSGEWKINFEDIKSEYQKISNNGIPDKDWKVQLLLGQDTLKIAETDAKRLYELLSDGKKHNIRGTIVDTARQYTITSWEEF